MHTKTAIFLRDYEPISNGISYSCGFLSCKFKNISKAVVNQHLLKHLQEEGVYDDSEEESIQKMIHFIETTIEQSDSSRENESHFSSY